MAFEVLEEQRRRGDHLLSDGVEDEAHLLLGAGGGALLDDVTAARERPQIPLELLTRAARLTDANAAVFDAANRFHGVIAGVHEVLRRQGLLEGIWCLDPAEGLSPGQAEEIERVSREHPDLTDDAFVARHLADWLS